MPDTDSPPVCDYEGSTYRTDFWEGQGRNYEDVVERRVLHRLLPKSGRRLLEVGAGFGRLTREYHAYEQVVLMDYSFSQLQYAREQLGADDRFVYVAANAYHLPFRPGIFDGATMIRVIHHMSDAPAVLTQIRSVLTPGAIFILEYANKRNLKAMLRHAFRRQKWNPYSLDPVEFIELNFDFHPDYIARELTVAGFKTGTRIPVSFFRLGALKDNLPTGSLAFLDGIMQRTGLLYSPSIFTRNTAAGSTPNNIGVVGENTDELFVCPRCGGELQREGHTLFCEAEGGRWEIHDGIYDFKVALG